MYKKQLLTLLCLVPSLVDAASDKFRVVWQENPDSEAKVIWDQVSGSAPIIHFGKLDHGQNAASYERSQTPESEVLYKGMANNYATLTGLEADTNYYFVVQDSEGVSSRYYFRTAPDTKKPFKFIQGGDSRNNRSVRQDGNLLVAKLRPLFVSFGGDMINSGSDVEWQNWLDDWQVSFASDGRIFPIVPIRGNHETADDMPKVFGINNSAAYYKMNVADNLFSLYLLNSEIDTNGAQKSWLSADLEANSGLVTFLSASYHKPMRPHVSSKSEGDAVYDSWSQLFYDYKFDLLAENDSHCVKRTVRVKPSIEVGSDEGFIAADDGFVLIGEGGWGAPLRSADDTKNWTLDSGSFNSFDLVNVYLDKMEVRTIHLGGATATGSLTELDDVSQLPAGLNVWQAAGGAVMQVNSRDRVSGIVSTNTSVFSFGSEWAYYDGVSAPDAAWNQSSFDDAAWSRGYGELGFGDGDETTVLDYGVSSSNKTATYYFRKQFSLDSLDDASSLSLDMVFDDGYVVYVNGQEIERRNMPSGTITHTTGASVTVIENEESNIVIPSSYLVVGTNTIAVEVHNRRVTSSDVSFDAAVESNQMNVGTPSTGTEYTIFAYNSDWTYYDGVSAPASDWKSLTFDDSSWSTGASELGFGDGDEATLLDYGVSTSNRTAAYYFRREFDLSHVDSETELKMDLIFDDGYVVYVNGQEVQRMNMPEGTITHTTYASTTVINNAVTTVVIPSSFLVVGTNIVTVEVHNRNGGSSDVSFNAELKSNQNIVEGPSVPVEVSVFDFGASWVYYDGVNAPATGWQAGSFDDSDWDYAAGELGFGDGDEATVLDYGGDPYNRTATYYFRKQFSLSSVDAETLLMLKMVYDDGAVVYVNGQEVHRVNMPSGPVSHTTYASVTVINNDVATIAIPSSYLVEGTNTIAVEMHNRRANSSDISFDAQLISNQTNVQDVAENLFENGSAWKYYDEVAAPAVTWNAEVFDDAAWQTGTGHFGFGDGDETTVLSYGSSSSNKTASYYFRKTVDIVRLVDVNSVTMNLTYDDGAVVYVNGQEVKRINMNTGVISHTTYASVTVINNDQASFLIPLSVLKEGENVIAVEIHNRNGHSSDVSFDAKLDLVR